jgi:hypothetical protein
MSWEKDGSRKMPVNSTKEATTVCQQSGTIVSSIVRVS